MKTSARSEVHQGQWPLRRTLCVGLLTGLTLSSASFAASAPTGEATLPWRAAGLGARAAAAHLLDRFAFGPRPGDIERVVATGLDRWLESQLEPVPDPALASRLEDMPSLHMAPEHIRQRYASFGRLRRMMKHAGAYEDPTAVTGEAIRDPAFAERRMLRAYARQTGLATERDLIDELVGQKLLHAVYSRNQLREVLTGFWLDHFHVSILDSEVTPAVTSFERDAIRPRALGTFLPLLEATARHPAMLAYLDNARSGAAEGATRAFDLDAFLDVWAAEDGARIVNAFRRQSNESNRGINENYARELLELHTVGVDGGYDEHDVRETARAFTGWTVMPPGVNGRVAAPKVLTLLSRRPGSGFVVDGEFLFRADRHDADAKRVLGVSLAAGRGIDDGRDVLRMLAKHPSTARHLARKLAVRFVSDDPPDALVDRLSEVFARSGGDTRALIRAIARSPHFWSAAARHGKVKTPFELAASALRATGAEIENPLPVMRRVAKLGQPAYAATAPTGFPDTAEAWLNGGTVVARLRFGLDLAAGAIAGLDIDLGALTGEMRTARRKRVAKRLTHQLLPGRDAPTLAPLESVLRDPRIGTRLANELRGDTRGGASRATDELIAFEDFEVDPERSLATVAGLILGSPAFQRR